MAHICPNCFEPAPKLFGFCPECDFGTFNCDDNCEHAWINRNEMIERAEQHEEKNHEGHWVKCKICNATEYKGES